VNFAGLIHPGLIGCLPDRHAGNVERARNRPDRHRPERVPPLANPPFAATAHMGKLAGEARDKAAARRPHRAAARARRQLRHQGSVARLEGLFPVYVDGAGLSVGDLHFSQGDGEITFCGAIEMAGWVHMRVNLIKGGMAKYGIKNPSSSPARSRRTTTTT
jgi:formamidase